MKSSYHFVFLNLLSISCFKIWQPIQNSKNRLGSNSTHLQWFRSDPSLSFMTPIRLLIILSASVKLFFVNKYSHYSNHRNRFISLVVQWLCLSQKVEWLGRNTWIYHTYSSFPFSSRVAEDHSTYQLTFYSQTLAQLWLLKVEETAEIHHYQEIWVEYHRMTFFYYSVLFLPCCYTLTNLSRKACKDFSSVHGT